MYTCILNITRWCHISCRHTVGTLVQIVKCFFNILNIKGATHALDHDKSKKKKQFNDAQVYQNDGILFFQKESRDEKKQ